MRMFRFICWLRGWHVNAFQVDRTEGIELFGKGQGCRVCGMMPLEGKTKYAQLLAQWPYKPEPQPPAGASL